MAPCNCSKYTCTCTVSLVSYCLMVTWFTQLFIFFLFFSTVIIILGDLLTAAITNISAPLGSSVFWPFRAGFDIPFGDPFSSANTYSLLSGPYSSGQPLLYEVSPFNYGLYFDIIRFADNGNYTVGFVESVTQLFTLTVTG